LLIDRWKKESYGTHICTFNFDKGKTYKVRLEYYENSGSARIKLVWNMGLRDSVPQQISEAVALARQSEVAVIVAGIEEGEFRDRASLDLPGQQSALINAVAATGTPLVVILCAGSAVDVTPWMNSADAILQVWYPGTEGGTAVAEVLFGAYNPAGRLPITWPMEEGQLPMVYNHKPTGRGDDYVNASGMPRYPFGYGLSYTSFSYHDLAIDKKSFARGDSARLTFQLTNDGPMDGEEVVQLYVHDELSSVVRPVTELKGFQRIFLKAGETKNITLILLPEMFSMLNANMQELIEPGTFKVMLGASSLDVRLRTQLQLY
jgi:beta-glucosidase